MANNFLQEGLKIVTEAVKEDSAGNHAQAIKLYDSALDNLHKAELSKMNLKKKK